MLSIWFRNVGFCLVLYLAWLSKAEAQNATKPINFDDHRKGKIDLVLALTLLDTADPDFERSFPRFLRQNPQWAKQALTIIREWSQTPITFDEKAREWAVLLQGFRNDPEVSAWVVEQLKNPKTKAALPRRLLQVMAEMQAPPADAWIAEIGKLLKEPAWRRDILAMLKNHGMRDFERTTATIARDESLPLEDRLAAMDAIASRLTLSEKQFRWLTKELLPQDDPLMPLIAGRVLAGVRLTDDQAKELAKGYSKWPPSIGLLLLPAFGRLRTPEVGKELVQGLSGSPTAKWMTPPDLDRILAAYPDEVLESARTLRAEFVRREDPQQAEWFAKISRRLPPGDVSRGRKVYFESKAACVSCHRAEGQGGGIGPNLSRIGFLRNSTELLESLLLPNASILPEFRSWKVKTDRGSTFTGYWIMETAETMLLREIDRRTKRIPRRELESITISRVSLMPQGLGEVLTEQQLADLVQYLLELR